MPTIYQIKWSSDGASVKSKLVGQRRYQTNDDFLLFNFANFEFSRKLPFDTVSKGISVKDNGRKGEL